MDRLGLGHADVAAANPSPRTRSSPR
ncbi:MAG TPA: hypothetical protein VHF51_18485 [Solirubrobacteraceae bacterium]|nr:hypothetical protein [Solirubrobacteraceae bacterium]